MEQCCGNCRWYSAPEHLSGICRFPLPFWVMRELHDPLAGHGPLVSVVHADTGHDYDCPCHAPKGEGDE